LEEIGGRPTRLPYQNARQVEALIAAAVPIILSETPFIE
jgi:hypothetical protein